jgi:beta-phosphoglucomutase
MARRYVGHRRSRRAKHDLRKYKTTKFKTIMKQAVIFDVDGVLVDSYQAHYEGWVKAGKEWGFSITEEQFVKTFGRTSREVIVDTFGMTWLSDEEIKQLDAQKEALYREIVAESFPAMDGAEELLDALHRAGFALAVGSSGPPPNVDVVLDYLRRRHLFGAIITGIDVTRGKPDPQVFLLGAERLDIPPKQCVVIEDAPAGVAAAKNAGMKSIGFVSTGRSTDELRGADKIIRSLRELSPDGIRHLLSNP